MLPWESITPLGLPVVPEVKTISAMSWGSDFSAGTVFSVSIWVSRALSIGIKCSTVAVFSKTSANPAEAIRNLESESPSTCFTCSVLALASSGIAMAPAQITAK